MKMQDVCSVFQQAGMKQVSSVLASGNILFQADETPERLRPDLELALTKWYEAEVSLFILNKTQLENLLEAVPFESSEEMHIYVFVCEAGFETTLEQNFLEQENTFLEEGKIKNNFFFWKVAKGETLKTPFSKILSKKAYQSKFTSRNLNTIQKIVAKMK